MAKPSRALREQWARLTASRWRSPPPEGPPEDDVCGRCHPESRSKRLCRECREDKAEQDEHDRDAWERTQEVDLG